jgi:hypothetical protein
VQRWLAATLDRRVEFNDEAGGTGGVRVGLLRGVQVTAQRIEIGAPAWSKARHTLLAQDARLRLGYLRPLARLARRAAAHQGPRGARARRRGRAPCRRPDLVAVRQEGGRR